LKNKNRVPTNTILNSGFISKGKICSEKTWLRVTNSNPKEEPEIKTVFISFFSKTELSVLGRYRSIASIFLTVLGSPVISNFITLSS
jgi:hypothetical protein